MAVNRPDVLRADIKTNISRLHKSIIKRARRELFLLIWGRCSLSNTSCLLEHCSLGGHCYSHLKKRNQRAREVHQSFKAGPGSKPMLMWQQGSESLLYHIVASNLKSWSARSWNFGLWHHRYVKSSCQYHLLTTGPWRRNPAFSRNHEKIMHDANHTSWGNG